VGCKDTVEDGKNGSLIPIKDSDSLAAKLAILIEDRQLREQMGKCSREKAEKEFSLKMVVEKHLNVYEQLD
jgi:N,N'-diacetylbacillosaminyl-diphospho-undecaprenol alpha-1,3-N-acetylgalactosaminyltransferase